MNVNNEETKVEVENTHYFQLLVKDLVDKNIAGKILKYKNFFILLISLIIPMLSFFGYNQYLSYIKFSKLNTNFEKISKNVKTIEETYEKARKLNIKIRELEENYSDHQLNLNQTRKVLKTKEININTTLDELSGTYDEFKKRFQQSQLEYKKMQDMVENITRIKENITTAEKEIKTLKQINKEVLKIASKRMFVLRRDQGSYEIKLPDFENVGLGKFYYFRFSIGAIKAEFKLNCTFIVPGTDVQQKTYFDIRAIRKNQNTILQEHRIGTTPYSIECTYVNDDWLSHDYVVMNVLPWQPKGDSKILKLN